MSGGTSVTSEQLRAILPHLPGDYSDYGGNVERWADPAQSYPDCSHGCRFAAWLEDHAADWLVCVNPASHRAGLLTFEHQGCQQFERAVDE
jgi:hypothetical protein